MIDPQVIFDEHAAGFRQEAANLARSAELQEAVAERFVVWVEGMSEEGRATVGQASAGTIEAVGEILAGLARTRRAMQRIQSVLWACQRRGAK